MTYLHAVSPSDIQEQQAEREQRRIEWLMETKSRDPVHRVLAGSHPELYLNYIRVERELEQAQSDLWKVENKLKSGRLTGEQRTQYKARRADLQTLVADRESARAYKVEHLLETKAGEIDDKRKLALLVLVLNELQKLL